jgi:hypothetical protein
VSDVLVQRILAGQLRLHRDELGDRIADERNEKQSGVQMPESVGAVGEVLAPAQDLDSAEMF